jgi:DnaJ-class molecular chaperone
MESVPSAGTPSEDFSHLPSIPEIANKYELLGVPQGASTESLKLAYRRLALLYHPDRHVEADRDSASEVFKRITAAYRTLSDPEGAKAWKFADYSPRTSGPVGLKKGKIRFKSQVGFATSSVCDRMAFA